MIDEQALVAKYSKMTQQQLIDEWEYWVARNADWEQIQVFAREKGRPESAPLIREAIADNETTIELLEQFIYEQAQQGS